MALAVSISCDEALPHSQELPGPKHGVNLQHLTAQAKALEKA
jgi:hypothetical protein